MGRKISGGWPANAANDPDPDIPPGVSDRQRRSEIGGAILMGGLVVLVFLVLYAVLRP